MNNYIFIVSNPDRYVITYEETPRYMITYKETPRYNLTLRSAIGPKGDPGQDGEGSVNNSWTYFVTTWSEPPTFNSNISGGSVYNYILNGITRYRFIPTSYISELDCFYGSFISGVLSNPIISRV